MKRTTSRPLNQGGFTIIELLIATLVFSVILIVITVGVISFTNAYYKGVNSSTTQNTTRQTLATVTQAIQFSGGSISSTLADPIGTYCIGNEQFDYHLGKQIVNVSTDHVLYETHWDSNTPCTAKAFDNAKSKELLDVHMRLASFSVSPPSGSTGLYTVHLRVVYGDDDLLSNPTAQNASCKLHTGAQFCAVSDLTTSVQKRVQ